MKDTVKPSGHYKPNYEQVEPRVLTNVKYAAGEHREELIEKAGVRKRGRDITCCNRVLRVIERQQALSGGNSEIDEGVSMMVPKRKGAETEQVSPNGSVPQSPQRQDSISDPSVSNMHSAERNNKSLSKESKGNNRVLFFRKSKDFAYQNIPISPNYHMVVEEDNDLCPKIAILPSNVPQPEPPKGSWILTPTTKVGPIALFRTPLDRN